MFSFSKPLENLIGAAYLSGALEGLNKYKTLNPSELQSYEDDSKHVRRVLLNRAESDGSMEFKQKQSSSKIIQGEFSLKNLGYFIKCTNLSPQVEMYLANDLPLVVKYDVASLGSIKLCLSALPST